MPGDATAGAWSPNNAFLATGHEDGTVTISSAEPGGKVVTLRPHRDQIYHLAWSPDSTRLASTSANDFFVSIWDIASAKMVLGPLRHSHGITAIAWGADGRQLATGSMDETVKVWDALTGQEIATLRGQLDATTSLAWGPDGQLAAGGADGSMRIFHSTHDQEWSVLPGEVRETAVAWSPDGTRLASAGDDGKIRIWDPVIARVVMTIDSARPSGDLSAVRSDSLACLES